MFIPKKGFKCHHCNHVSKTKTHLLYHMEVHFNPRNRVERISCPMCSHRACNRPFMLRHYAEVHDVSITPEKYEFKSYEEFLSWKSDLHKKEHCSYVARNGPHKNPNKVRHKFRCFRDGFYTSQGKGKRRLKVGGSDKINGICPSTITASVDNHSGVVTVSYVVSHVGHDTDVGRLNLPKDERDAIAQKIAAKVPFDVILGEYKDSGNCQLDRANLVIRKDLWNIVRSYHLNVSGISPNDSVSVESWVNRNEKSNIDSNLTKEKRHKTGETAENSVLNSTSKKQKDEIFRIHAAGRKDVHHDKHIKLSGPIMHRNDASNDDMRVQRQQISGTILHRNNASNDDMRVQRLQINGPIRQRIDARNDDMRVQRLQIDRPILHQNDANNDDIQVRRNAEENAQPTEAESSDDKFRCLVETMLAMTKRHPGQLSSAVIGDAEKLFQKMTEISDDLENTKLLLSIRNGCNIAKKRPNLKVEPEKRTAEQLQTSNLHLNNYPEESEE